MLIVTRLLEEYRPYDTILCKISRIATYVSGGVFFIVLFVMAYYHTINTANKMNNQINGINPFNPKLGVYKEAAVGMLGYAWNQVSNEILYWTEN